MVVSPQRISALASAVNIDLFFLQTSFLSFIEEKQQICYLTVRLSSVITAKQKSPCRFADVGVSLMFCQRHVSLIGCRLAAG